MPRRSGRSRGSNRLLLYILAYLLAALTVTAVIAYTYRQLMTHPHFAVAELTVDSPSKRVVSDLTKKLQWARGKNFFSIDLARLRNEALDHPWVEDANVRGTLPNKLKVLVTEKEPAGLVRINNRIYVIAADTKPIAPFEEYTGKADFPVIQGVEKSANHSAAITRGLQALQTIQATSIFFWDQIETLDLSNGKNMIVQLRSVSAPIHLGEDVIPDNIKNYLSIAQRIEREYPRLHYIELGFPNKIAILPKEVD